MDLRAGRTIGAQALVHWQHPVDGNHRPYTFIPLAEEIALVMGTGEFVLRDACQQAVRWGQSSLHPADLLVRANLSARQVTDAGTVQAVLS